MKAIILAAGYATRLYPLTKNFPKSLLKIANKTILDFIVEKINKIKLIDDIFIVTNDKFYKYFFDWNLQGNYSKSIKIINDMTKSNEDRIGAIADIKYVIDKENLESDVLVLAGDNIFDFELVEMVEFFLKQNTDIVSTHEVNELDRLRRTGVIELDVNDRIISFEEKPEKPKSNLAVPPFYIYKKDTINLLIDKYLNEGNEPDAPGNFVPWLIKHKPVYAFKFKGNRYDIGNIESYELVKKMYEGTCKNYKDS